MKKLTLIFSFCLVAIFAQAQQATEATVREMITVTGATNTYIEMMRKSLDNAKKDTTDYMPKEYYDEIMKGMNADSLTSLLIPVYKKNYTEQDLRQVILFYKTVDGKKLANQTSIIIQESNEVLGKWIQGVSKKAMEEMEKKGRNSAYGPSAAEMEMMRIDSLAMAEATAAQAAEDAKAAVIYNTPAGQKAQDEYDKAVAKAYKKRQKALDKIKKQ
jgi:uncharacterized protein